jgi:VWFA-related protein
MHTPHAFIRRVFPASLIGIALVAVALGQGRTSKPSSAQAEDVVRVNTELVQTDVTVVDKRGRFVEDLRPEQFELSVGGKPHPISFFEQVTAGSRDEERQLAAARGGNRPARTTSPAPGRQPERGRSIFFFVDDVHLASENLARARVALLRFIEDGMGEKDQAAILSTSGQISFLQQLSNNKTVLREAVARLSFKRNPEVNAGPVSISEYDADQVEARNRELFRYLVNAMAKINSTAPAQAVIARTRQISATARMDTVNTLSMLESLLRSTAPLPGRKLIFFISDGFVADPRRSGVVERMEHVTKVAAQVGAVIYTMDARGTFGDTSIDASKNPYPDFTGSVSRNIFAEALVTQEPLRILADNTGGQAILNSNSFDEGFRRALDDSSNYYLLAWRPEGEEQLGVKARIRVSVKGRPELKVRVRRGFIEPPVLSPSQKETSANSEALKSPEGELLSALGALYPLRALPLALSVGYINTPNQGMVLAASMQLDAGALWTDAAVENEKAEIDVLGVALDDRGSISSFKQKLNVPAESFSRKGQRAIVWHQQLPLPPGLYQVRVVARERQSGRTGSAMQWIEIPLLKPEDFSMSSIFIGERKAQDAPPAPTVPVSVSRRFARESRMRFQTYFYHAARQANLTDVSVQVQILRDGQAVFLVPQSKLTANNPTDPERLPFSGEIALERLPAASYVLQISATDKMGGRSVTQRTDFVIE